LSALSTGRLYPQEIFLVLVCVRCWDLAKYVLKFKDGSGFQQIYKSTCLENIK